MTHLELMVTIGVILLLVALAFADEWLAAKREAPPPWYPLE
jgi:hypothetical protein